MSELKDLVPVNYDDPERPTVSGRELHDFLEVKSKYADWFKNMSGYGFTENIDYVSFSKNLENGGRTIDHQLTIPMAKELCMIQRNERGKQARQYFLAIEAQWNSPEAVMRRAVLIADKKVKQLQTANRKLLAENNDLKPDAEFARAVCIADNCRTATSIAKDYGLTAESLNKLLHSQRVQYKDSDGQWVLYKPYQGKGYTKNRKSKPIQHSNGKVKVHNTTVWTVEGEKLIHEQLKKLGITPKIETRSIAEQQYFDGLEG